MDRLGTAIRCFRVVCSDSVKGIGNGLLGVDNSKIKRFMLLLTLELTIREVAP